MAAADGQDLVRMAWSLAASVAMMVVTVLKVPLRPSGNYGERVNASTVCCTHIGWLWWTEGMTCLDLQEASDC